MLCTSELSKEDANHTITHFQTSYQAPIDSERRKNTINQYISFCEKIILELCTCVR